MLVDGLDSPEAAARENGGLFLWRRCERIVDNGRRHCGRSSGKRRSGERISNCDKCYGNKRKCQRDTREVIAHPANPHWRFVHYTPLEPVRICKPDGLEAFRLPLSQCRIIRLWSRQLGCQVTGCAPFVGAGRSLSSRPPFATSCAASTVWITLAMLFVVVSGAPSLAAR